MVNGTEVAVRCYPMAIRHRDSTQSRERDGGKGSKWTVYRSSWCSHGLFWPLLEKNLSYISLYVFVHNCQQPLNKITGPLTATEISAQRLLWIKRAQQQGPDHKNFHENEQQLNLQKNEDGLLECRGRIQGEYPFFYRTTWFIQWRKFRERIWLPYTEESVSRCQECGRSSGGLVSVS